MIRFLGIDLHKHLLVACAIDEAGNVLARLRLEEINAESLGRWCKRYLRASDQVAMEATTNTWAVARALRPHVAKVVISNPLATKAIAAAKVKTDKVDALVLAQLLRCGYLPEVWQPDEPQQRLREWTARRSRLVGQHTALVNRIRSTLAMRLLDCPHALDTKAGRAWLAAAPLPDDARWLVESDLRMLDAVEAELAAIDEQLAQRGYDDLRVKLLMTLPGVSQHTAQAILAAVGDVTRFRDAKSLASYLGLVPSTRQSATKSSHGPITKAGRSQARWMLVQAAQSVRDNPGPLGYFFRRLKRKKNHNVAVVAVAHKLTLLAWYLLTSGQPYRYALPPSTEAKLAKLRIAATGQRRQGGVARGIDPRTVHEPGSKGRTQRGLPDVCASEGLPHPSPAPPGERKHLAALDLQAFAANLAQTKTVPRPN